jgi:ankyrin repeat protein
MDGCYCILPPREDHLEVVAALLNSGSDTNAGNIDEHASLHYAARNSHLEVARELLAYGADKNAKDRDGWTPSHTAAFYGHLAVVQELLTHGADITTENSEGDTSPSLAQIRKRLKVIQVLSRVTKGTQKLKQHPHLAKRSLHPFSSVQKSPNSKQHVDSQ